MGSDNIFEQVEALIASDQRQQLPESVDAILKAIAKVPGAGPLVAVVRYESERQRVENSELMLRTLWGELKRVASLLDSFQQQSANHDGVRRLILDATHKAEDLRDRKRVERIAKILAHALTLGPQSNFDRAEELMRNAMDLSDQDVLALQYLYDHQFEYLQKNGWKTEHNTVLVIWRDTPPKIPGTTLPGEIDGIFLKLQALGLSMMLSEVSFQPNSNSKAYALLPKGADFVRYIQGAVGTTQEPRGK